MEEVAILAGGDDAAAIRRWIGGQLGDVLRAATGDPARMMPLWRAFARGEPVRAGELGRSVSEDFVDQAIRHELLCVVDATPDETWVRGTLCVVAAHVGGELLWVVSDFDWYEDDPSFVTGPGEASGTLLSAVPDGVYRRVLDMGCGSGALGVRLSAGDGSELTASDINPRALALTELTAAVNQRAVRTVRSSFADAIFGTFDLVVCNPPFILGRPRATTLFHDSDDHSGHAAIALELGPLLDVGGLALYLTNWEYPLGGQDPLEALGEQLREVDGCDVLLWERALVPVQRYVEMAAKDEEDHAAWIAGFLARDVAHIGTGLVAVARTESDERTVTVSRDSGTPRGDLHRVIQNWRETPNSHR